MEINTKLYDKIRDKILQNGTIVTERYIDALVNDVLEMCPQELEQNM